jgi:hypothetical protein
VNGNSYKESGNQLPSMIEEGQIFCPLFILILIAYIICLHFPLIAETPLFKYNRQHFTQQVMRNKNRNENGAQNIHERFGIHNK